MSRDPSGRTPRRGESKLDREMAGASHRSAASRGRAAEPAGSDGDEDARGTRGDGTVVAEGLAAVAVVVGVFLIFVPEPVTSLLGAVLVTGGAAGLLRDASSGAK
ncbi:hypothetical protein [Halomicrobium salinisoli]|uniref:hypothetical protein n=1 Tax=Halomicrobium salinisoli TaxID=2878391 RepID=UPI001CF09009|nr:hypothetical protein [Halomicrobium salinisoli]